MFRFIAAAVLALIVWSAGAQAQYAWPTPSGRLTLTSNTPVMTADVTAVSTIYYDCYNGGNLIPWYNGTTWQVSTIAGCQLTLTLETSGTGVENTTGVFDIFYQGTAAALCVPTNNSGGGWASDTGGSNTARGTGYSQLTQTAGPVIYNTNTVSFCYNATTNECATPCTVGTLTYLGTFYTTAAGQTGVALAAAAGAGGSHPTLGLWNAYNRVSVMARVQDNTAPWHVNTASTWEALDQGASSNFNNRITYVDGLKQSNVKCSWQVYITNGSSLETPSIGCLQTATTGTPISISLVGAPTSGATTVFGGVNFYPAIGVNYVQLMEFSASTTLGTFGNTNGAEAEGFLELQM